MQSKQVSELGNQRTYVLVLTSDEEIFSAIKEFSTENEIRSGYCFGIGALQSAVLGFFERETMDYKKIAVNEQVEVLSLMGNISRKNGDVVVHAHMILGKSDGSTVGGHLLEATVWPRLELFLVETPAELRRTLDPETGLTLLDLQS